MPTRAWFVDELVLAGRENLDPQHVAHYDSKEDASAASEVVLLKDLGLSRQSLVVEFGAGTGQFTIAVARQCRRVIAADVSPPMLRQLEAKTEAASIKNVETVRAGFLTYVHSGAPADVIYSRFALHHLPDFWKVIALNRMRQILRPAGLLRLWDVVYDFEPREAEDQIAAWCERYGAASQDEWGREDVEEHVRDEHSTFRWLLEPMFQRCGFQICRAEHDEAGPSSKYVLKAV